MKILWICLVTLVSLAIAVPNLRQRTVFRQPRISLKEHDLGIVGGQQANIDKYPYTVSITYDPQKYLIGGGAILNKNWIVCSAYEIQYFKSAEKQLSVRAGSNKAQSGGQKVNVSKVIMHERFHGDFPYDIALIKTGMEIQFSKQAKPIKLAKTKPKKGTKAQITGYGDSLVPSGDLLVATVQIKSTADCTKQHGGIGDTCQCADNTGIGPCTSDLGDPLVHNKQLLGWFIGGDLCNYLNYLEVYTNAAALRSWVIETIEKNSNADEIEGIDNEEFYAAYYDDEINNSVEEGPVANNE